MTLTETTPTGQSERLSFELVLSHPPAKVWRALTEPALLSEWLLPIVELELEPGAAFEFRAPPQPGWDGLVSCRLVEAREGELLRYRWVAGGIDTEMTFTLSATAAGTLLSIVQSGFAEAQKQNFGGARYGWRMMSGRLEETLGRLP